MENTEKREIRIGRTIYDIDKIVKNGKKDFEKKYGPGKNDVEKRQIHRVSNPGAIYDQIKAEKDILDGK